MHHHQLPSRSHWAHLNNPVEVTRDTKDRGKLITRDTRVKALPREVDISNATMATRQGEEGREDEELMEGTERQGIRV